MNRRVSRVLIGVVLCSSLVTAAEPPGAESPEALVQRMSEAGKKGDFAELAACMDPESRAEMAQALLAGTTMMVAFAGLGGAMAGEMAQGMAEAFAEEGADVAAAAEAEEEMAGELEALEGRYEELLATHGLERMMEEEPSGEEDLAALLAGVDQIALIGDLMGFMEEFPGSTSSETKATLDISQVSGYEIDGDHATAQGPEGPIEFVRIDGRWYAKIDAEMGGGMEGGMDDEMDAAPEDGE